MNFSGSSSGTDLAAPDDAPKKFTVRTTLTQQMIAGGYILLHSTFPVDAGLVSDHQPEASRYLDIPISVQAVTDTGFGGISCRLVCRPRHGKSVGAARSHLPHAARHEGAQNAAVPTGEAMVCRICGLQEWMESRRLKEGSRVLLRFVKSDTYKLSEGQDDGNTASFQQENNPPVLSGKAVAPTGAAAEEAAHAAKRSPLAPVTINNVDGTLPVLAAKPTAVTGLVCGSAILPSAALKAISSKPRTQLASAASGRPQQHIDEPIARPATCPQATAGPTPVTEPPAVAPADSHPADGVQRLQCFDVSERMLKKAFVPASIRLRLKPDVSKRIFSDSAAQHMAVGGRLEVPVLIRARGSWSSGIGADILPQEARAVQESGPGESVHGGFSQAYIEGIQAWFDACGMQLGDVMAFGHEPGSGYVLDFEKPPRPQQHQARKRKAPEERDCKAARPAVNKRPYRKPSAGPTAFAAEAAAMAEVATGAGKAGTAHVAAAVMARTVPMDATLAGGGIGAAGANRMLIPVAEQSGALPPSPVEALNSATAATVLTPTALVVDVPCGQDDLARAVTAGARMSEHEHRSKSCTTSSMSISSDCGPNDVIGPTRPSEHGLAHQQPNAASFTHQTCAGAPVPAGTADPQVCCVRGPQASSLPRDMQALPVLLPAAQPVGLGTTPVQPVMGPMGRHSGADAAPPPSSEPLLSEPMVLPASSLTAVHLPGCGGRGVRPPPLQPGELRLCGLTFHPDLAPAVQCSMQRWRQGMPEPTGAGLAAWEPTSKQIHVPGVDRAGAGGAASPHQPVAETELAHNVAAAFHHFGLRRNIVATRLARCLGVAESWAADLPTDRALPLAPTLVAPGPDPVRGGQGLFAAEPIKKSWVLGVVGGYVMPRQVAEDFSMPGVRRGKDVRDEVLRRTGGHEDKVSTAWELLARSFRLPLPGWAEHVLGAGVDTALGLEERGGAAKLELLMLGYSNEAALINDPWVMPTGWASIKAPSGGPGAYDDAQMAETNCAILPIFVRGVLLPVLVATHEIAPGQQIFREYGKTWWHGLKDVWEVMEDDGMTAQQLLHSPPPAPPLHDPEATPDAPQPDNHPTCAVWPQYQEQCAGQALTLPASTQHLMATHQGAVYPSAGQPLAGQQVPTQVLAHTWFNWPYAAWLQYQQQCSGQTLTLPVSAGHHNAVHQGAAYPSASQLPADQQAPTQAQAHAWFYGPWVNTAYSRRADCSQPAAFPPEVRTELGVQGAAPTGGPREQASRQYLAPPGDAKAQVARPGAARADEAVWTQPSRQNIQGLQADAALNEALWRLNEQALEALHGCLQATPCRRTEQLTAAGLPTPTMGAQGQSSEQVPSACIDTPPHNGHHATSSLEEPGQPRQQPPPSPLHQPYPSGTAKAHPYPVKRAEVDAARAQPEISRQVPGTAPDIQLLLRRWDSRGTAGSPRQGSQKKPTDPVVAPTCESQEATATPAEADPKLHASLIGSSGRAQSPGPEGQQQRSRTRGDSAGTHGRGPSSGHTKACADVPNAASGDGIRSSHRAPDERLLVAARAHGGRPSADQPAGRSPSRERCNRSPAAGGDNAHSPTRGDGRHCSCSGVGSPTRASSRSPGLGRRRACSGGRGNGGESPQSDRRSPGGGDSSACHAQPGASNQGGGQRNGPDPSLSSDHGTARDNRIDHACGEHRPPFITGGPTVAAAVRPAGVAMACFKAKAPAAASGEAGTAREAAAAGVSGKARAAAASTSSLAVASASSPVAAARAPPAAKLASAATVPKAAAAMPESEALVVPTAPSSLAAPTAVTSTAGAPAALPAGNAAALSKTPAVGVPVPGVQASKVAAAATATAKGRSSEPVVTATTTQAADMGPRVGPQVAAPAGVAATNAARAPMAHAAEPAGKAPDAPRILSTREVPPATEVAAVNPTPAAAKAGAVGHRAATLPAAKVTAVVALSAAAKAGAAGCQAGAAPPAAGVLPAVGLPAVAAAATASTAVAAPIGAGPVAAGAPPPGAALAAAAAAPANSQIPLPRADPLWQRPKTSQLQHQGQLGAYQWSQSQWQAQPSWSQWQQQQWQPYGPPPWRRQW